MYDTKISRAAERPRLSIKAQTLMTIAAIILPMHLPIILVGLLAGPYAGAISGLLGPVASFALSGMPSLAMLPFMMVELCSYGLISGLLRNANIPTVAKVLIVQLGGRLVRAAAILIAVFGIGSRSIGVAAIWTSTLTGIFGIALQLTLIPLTVYRLENLRKRDE